MTRTHARVRAATLAVVVALLVTTGAVASSPAWADAGAEADFVSRINGARSGRGIGGLATDGELTSIARRWSQRMANEQRLSHNPNLSREVSHDWEKLAENVGFGGDVASIHEAFMNSSTHRANILDAAMTHVGVGVVVDGAGQIWVTEVFMRIRGGGSPTTTAAPPPPPQPPPPPPPPAPTTTRPPRPATTAPPATALPAPEPTSELVAPVLAEPEPSTATEVVNIASSEPTQRLVLVLNGLRDLDEGR